MDFTSGKVIRTDRVAAVVRRSGFILLQRAEDGLILPGGRIELLEHSTDALRRELFENLSVHATVGSLAFVVENLFDHGGFHVHQLIFVYDGRCWRRLQFGGCSTSGWDGGL